MNLKLVKLVVRGGPGVAVLVLKVFAAWLFSLRPAPVGAVPAPICRQEAEATLAALKRPKRQRPIIAISGINDATETTDYLAPYGILKRADVTDVVLLADEDRNFLRYWAGGKLNSRLNARMNAASDS
jgi:hypothetical protein